MKKWSVLFAAVLLAVAGFWWNSTRVPVPSGKGEEVTYEEQIARIARDLMSQLGSGSSRTGELQQLYAEGRDRYERGSLTREQAANLDQAIRRLQELNKQRQQAEAELRRLQELPFSRIGEGQAADPEEKRAHFVRSHHRAWEQTVQQARPAIERVLADIR